MGWIPALIVAITFLANLLIVVVVWKNNPKSWTNRLLVILSALMALWTLTNYLALSPGTEETRLFWVRTVMFVTAPLGATTLFLAYVFPQEKLTVNKFLLMFCMVTTLLGMIAAPYMFTALHNTPDGGFSLTPGLPVMIFAFNHFGYTMFGLVALINKYKKSKGMLRRQYGWVVTGLSLTLLLMTITNFVAVVIFKTIQYTFLGPVMTLFQVGFVAYAIIRHKFLDVSLLASRAVSYTLLVAEVVVIEAGLLWLATWLLPANINKVSVAVGGSVLLVLSYDAIRIWIAKLTEKLFFQGKYDTEKVLGELTRLMASEIRIDELSKNLGEILKKRVKLTRAVFAIKGQEGDESKFWQELVSKTRDQDELIFDELEEGETKNFLRENDLGMVMKLKVKNERIGYLLIGHKSSGDLFSEQDIELLRLFVPNAAVALNNANNYKEIAKFNRTLEKKVEERTQELEISQREKLKKAAELLKLKDEFVFIATHDLASPITAISGYADLIRTSKEKMSKDLKENMDEIVTGASRLKDLVDDLLQVARSESGTIKVSVSAVNVNEVIEQVGAQVAPRAYDKQVKFTLKLDAKNKMVQGDRDKLLEVFENLFTNAVKYNKKGGSVIVTSKLVDKKLHIEVADTGYGIPKGEQDKVFSKFYRSESKEVRAEMGTGLGLFVVRMLVSKMGGRISFESTEGQGTTFRIILNTI